MQTKSVVTTNELVDMVNRKVESVLDSIAVTEWDENHISFVLVQSIRSTLDQIKVTPSHQHRTHYERQPEILLESQIYKVSGTPERKYGDICVIVHNTASDQIGTAFYEAKAEDKDGLYPAFKMRQLRKLSSSMPNLSLLLYEQTAKQIVDEPDNFFGIEFRNGSNPRLRTRVFGANIARCYRRPNDIRELPQSFGYHLITGVLSGRVLNYSKTPIKIIDNWLMVTKRSPPVMFLITIASDSPWRGSMNLNELITKAIDKHGYLPCSDPLTLELGLSTELNHTIDTRPHAEMEYIPRISPSGHES